MVGVRVDHQVLGLFEHCVNRNECAQTGPKRHDSFRGFDGIAGKRYSNIRQQIGAEPFRYAGQGELRRKKDRQGGRAEHQSGGRHPLARAPVALRQRECSEQRADRQGEAGARARHRLSRNEHNETGETQDERHDRRRGELFLSMPDGRAIARGPGGDQRHERIEQRRKMVSVGEEADGFRGAGVSEKPQGARRALRHLRQPDEGARKPHGKRHEAQ